VKARQSDLRKFSAFGVRAGLSMKEAQIRTSEPQTHSLPLLFFPLGGQSAPGFILTDPSHVEIAWDGGFGGKHEKKLTRAVFFSNFRDIYYAALAFEFRFSFFSFRVATYRMLVVLSTQELLMKNI
jgi:hypothetical protein